MKQTKNAIKFLMAQYRAILNNAHLMSILSASTTAALAVASTTAQATTDAWPDLRGNETLRAEQTFSGSGNISNTHGFDLRVLSGGDLTFQGTEYASGNFIVSTGNRSTILLDGGTIHLGGHPSNQGSTAAAVSGATVSIDRFTVKSGELTVGVSSNTKSLSSLNAKTIVLGSKNASANTAAPNVASANTTANAAASATTTVTAVQRSASGATLPPEARPRGFDHMPTNSSTDVVAVTPQTTVARTVVHAITTPISGWDVTPEMDSIDDADDDMDMRMDFDMKHGMDMVDGSSLAGGSVSLSSATTGDVPPPVIVTFEPASVDSSRGFATAEQASTDKSKVFYKVHTARIADDAAVGSSSVSDATASASSPTVVDLTGFAVDNTESKIRGDRKTLAQARVFRLADPSSEHQIEASHHAYDVADGQSHDLASVATNLDSVHAKAAAASASASASASSSASEGKDSEAVLTPASLQASAAQTKTVAAAQMKASPAVPAQGAASQQSTTVDGASSAQATDDKAIAGTSAPAVDTTTTASSTTSLASATGTAAAPAETASSAKDGAAGTIVASVSTPAPASTTDASGASHSNAGYGVVPANAAPSAVDGSVMLASAAAARPANGLEVVIGESGSLGGADTTDILMHSGKLTFSVDSRVKASNAVAVTGGEIQGPDANSLKTATFETPKLELSSGGKLTIERQSFIKVESKNSPSTVILGKGTLINHGGYLDLGTSGGTLLMTAADFDNNTGVFANRGLVLASGAKSDKTYSIIAVGNSPIDLGFAVREDDGTKFNRNIDVDKGKLVIAADDAKAFFSGSKIGYLTSGSFREVEAGKSGSLTIDQTALTIRESLTVPGKAGKNQLTITTANGGATASNTSTTSAATAAGADANVATTNANTASAGTPVSTASTVAAGAVASQADATTSTNGSVPVAIAAAKANGNAQSMAKGSTKGSAKGTSKAAGKGTESQYGTLALENKASLVLDGLKGNVNAKSITVGNTKSDAALRVKSGDWETRGLSVKSGTATVQVGTSLKLSGGAFETNGNGGGKVLVQGKLDAAEASSLALKPKRIELSKGGALVLNQPDFFKVEGDKAQVFNIQKKSPKGSYGSTTAVSGDMSSVVVFTDTTATAQPQTISVEAAKSLAKKLKGMNSFIQFDESKLRLDDSSPVTGEQKLKDIKDGARIIGLYKDVTLKADEVKDMVAVGNIKLAKDGLTEFTVKDTGIVLNNASANIADAQAQDQTQAQSQSVAAVAQTPNDTKSQAQTQPQAQMASQSDAKTSASANANAQAKAQTLAQSSATANGNTVGHEHGNAHSMEPVHEHGQGHGAAGKFVRDSKDAVAGLRLSGARASVTLNGSGQIGSINAANAGAGTVLIGSPAYAHKSEVEVLGSIGGEKAVSAVLVDRNASLTIHAGQDKDALRTSSLFVGHGGSIVAEGQHITVGAGAQNVKAGKAVASIASATPATASSAAKASGDTAAASGPAGVVTRYQAAKAMAPGADADKVAVINGKLKAKSLNLLGDKGQHHSIGGGAQVEVDTLSATKGIFIDVGQKSGPVAKTSVLASNLHLNGATLNLNHDTRREYATTSVLNLSGAKGNELDGKVLVGNNSVFAVGLPHTDVDMALQRLVKDRKFTDFSPPVGSAPSLASNAVILNKGISIDAKSGGLYVGPVPTTQVEPNSVTFDTNSALVLTDKAFAVDASGKKTGSAITLNANGSTKTAAVASTNAVVATAPAAAAAAGTSASAATVASAAAPATTATGATAGAVAPATQAVAAGSAGKVSVSPTAKLLLLGNFNGGDKNLTIVDGVSENAASQVDNFNVFTGTDLLKAEVHNGKLSFSLTKDKRIIDDAFKDTTKPIKDLLIDVLDGSKIKSRTSPAHDFLNEVAVSRDKKARRADAAAHALTYAGGQQAALAVVGTMTDAIASRVASVGIPSSNYSIATANAATSKPLSDKAVNAVTVVNGAQTLNSTAHKMNGIANAVNVSDDEVMVDAVNGADVVAASATVTDSAAASVAASASAADSVAASCTETVSASLADTSIHSEDALTDVTVGEAISPAVTSTELSSHETGSHETGSYEVDAGLVEPVSMAQESSEQVASEAFASGAATASAVAAPQAKGGVWVSPVYKAVDSYGFKSEGSIYGSDIDLAGMAFGADTVNGNLRFGTVFNIGSGKSKAKGNGSGLKDEFNYYGLGMYTAMGFGNLGLVGDASVNVLSHDVEGLGLKAKSHTKAVTMGLTGQYTINNPWVDVTPHLGARFIRLDTDSYKLRTDKGGIASTDFDVQNIFSVPLGVTLSKTYAVNDWLVAPSADLSITFSGGDTDVKSNTTFIGIRNIGLNTEVMDEVTYGLNFGLGAQYGAFGTSLGINYAGSNNTDSLSVKAQAHYVF